MNVTHELLSTNVALLEYKRKNRTCELDFFFFQAEDGIRDYKVTGVQTCALPICPRTCTMSTNPKTRLSVTNRTPDGGDRLRWGWIGSIAPSDDFGDPTTTDDYAI